MGYNRFRKKAQLRRQYTFTKSKMFVGFVLSTFFSILLSPYFERYGPKLLSQTRAAIMKLVPTKKRVSQIAKPEELPLPAEEIDELNRRMENLRKTREAGSAVKDVE